MLSSADIENLSCSPLVRAILYAVRDGEWHLVSEVASLAAHTIRPETGLRAIFVHQRRSVSHDISADIRKGKFKRAKDRVNTLARDDGKYLKLLDRRNINGRREVRLSMIECTKRLQKKSAANEAPRPIEIDGPSQGEFSTIRRKVRRKQKDCPRLEAGATAAEPNCTTAD